MEYNDDLLKQIASVSKGKYFRAADTQSLKEVFNEIDQMEKTKVEIEKTSDYRDLFPIFLLAGFVLLGSEVLLSQTIWKRLP
jgi:Ca-activated chloride channel family protein